MFTKGLIEKHKQTLRLFLHPDKNDRSYDKLTQSHLFLFTH